MSCNSANKHLPDAGLVERAALAQRVCADHRVPFILNDRPDLAADMGADGVHIGQEDMAPTDARRLMGEHALIGLSTHGEDDLGRARHEPVDYLSAGPVTPTPTKPGRPGTGLGYVSGAVRTTSRPVWVTGGVDPTSVVDMVAAGARHFVVVRWLTEASDPRSRARDLRQVIDSAIEEGRGHPANRPPVTLHMAAGRPSVQPVVTASSRVVVVRPSGPLGSG